MAGTVTPFIVAGIKSPSIVISTSSASPIVTLPSICGNLALRFPIDTFSKSEVPTNAVVPLVPNPGKVVFSVFAAIAVSMLAMFGIAIVPVKVGLVNIVALLSLVTLPKSTLAAVVFVFNRVEIESSPVPPLPAGRVPAVILSAFKLALVILEVPAQVDKAVFSTLFNDKPVFNAVALKASTAPVPESVLPKKVPVSKLAILPIVTAPLTISPVVTLVR